MLDIENFIKKIKAKSRLMGVDPGKTRIGISISDENRILATPLKTLVKNHSLVLISITLIPPKHINIFNQSVILRLNSMRG